ncbi:MAG: AI-2E family transporter [Candidatus Onthomonas sp.]
MRKRHLGDYVGIGLTALAVIAASILIFFFIYKFNVIKQLVLRLVDILMPFIVGGVIAYLLAPVYNVLCRNLDYYLSRKLKPRRARQLANGLSVLLSLLLALGLVVGLVALVVPQLISSVMGLINALPGYLDQTSAWLDQLFEDYNLGLSVQQAFDKFTLDFESWLTNDLLPSLDGLSKQLGDGVNSFLGGVFNGVLAVFQVLKNFVLGLIVAVYLLADKERLSALAKKLLYALLGVQRGNGAMIRIRYIHKVFGGFLLGKLLDSLIIGILCFIGASLLRLPYTLLVSVVIGVTNVIPFFGPFLGAVPCGLLILLTDPIKCVYFIIFILALQQFDGNILGPKILGNTTGLSAFSVLFAIILFGGLFGFVGMIIGVPLFAIIASIVTELVNGRLREKEMSLDTQDYVHLDYVDQQDRRYIKRKAPTEK